MTCFARGLPVSLSVLLISGLIFLGCDTGLSGPDLAVSNGPVAITAGNGGGSPSATGSGHLTISGELRTFTFSAFMKKGNAKGQVQGHNRTLDVSWHAAVTCVSFDGNTAWIGTTITKSDIPAQVGQDGIFRVVDNGEGQGAPPDQITLFAPVVPGTAAAYCSNQPINLSLNDIEHGNVQVR